MSDAVNNISDLSPVKMALLAKKIREQTEGVEFLNAEPIAIVGAGCRFPGGANSPDEFWKLLQEGRDAVREVPRDRWNADEFYDEDRNKEGKIYTKWGAFLDEIDQFDAQFFGISPKEASSMDPQQRLALEVAWETFENAGISPDDLAGSRTGVFIGVGQDDYAEMELKQADPRIINAYTGTGLLFSAVSGRISYALGLQGPSITVDGACASSLMTTHLACQSLRSGECSLALAGGVHLIVTPAMTVYLSRSQALSPDGRCKTFDASANGYARGEGCGIIALKRLSDALADGNSILALIRGSALNHGGASQGFTVPNGVAQQELIREALKNSGVHPEQISYLEAHGTGTELGDPIEVNAMRAVFAKGRKKSNPLYIGSVKTNIGHLEAGAGIAGLLKTALALHKKTIPPHLHFKKPNPHLDLDAIPAIVPVESVSWEAASGRRLAGVSSFGITGQNAHVILEEAPEIPVPAGEIPKPPYWLPLSARDPAALKDAALGMKNYIEEHCRTDENLYSICRDAALGRARHVYRSGIAAFTKDEMTKGLEALLEDDVQEGVIPGRKILKNPARIAFIFTGQGSQWPAMGRELLESNAIFRAKIEEIDGLFSKYADWSLLDELKAEEDASRLTETEAAQPAIFAVQIALTEVWRSWGVQPEGVAGHSVGEVAAACVSGKLSLEDAVKVIYHRSRLMQQATGLGKMAAVELSREKLIPKLKGLKGKLELGALNGPDSCVLSGEESTLNDVLSKLQKQKVRVKMLPVNYAFHSPQMEPFKNELAKELDGLKPAASEIPMYSTVTGEEVKDGGCDAVYWGANIREPVRFVPAMENLARDGFNVFLEVGPHPSLATYIAACVEQSGMSEKDFHVGHSLRKQKSASMTLLSSLGALYAVGCEISFRGIFPSRGRFESLPTYPWQHERFWSESHEKTGVVSLTSERKGHAFWGAKVRSTLPDIQFESVFTAEAPYFLRDHVLYDEVVVPGASHMALVLSGVREAFGEDACTIENSFFEQALILPADEARYVHLVLSPTGENEYSFQVKSSSVENEDWVLHAQGDLSTHTGLSAPGVANFSAEDIQAGTSSEMTGDEFYEQFWNFGYHLSDTFRWIHHAWRRDGEVLGLMKTPENVNDREDYVIFPSLFDAFYQLATLALPGGGLGHFLDGEHIYVPWSNNKVQYYGNQEEELWCHIVCHDTLESTKPGQEIFKGDLKLYNKNGTLVAEIQGWTLKKVSSKSLLSLLKRKKEHEMLYRLGWEPRILDLKTSNQEAGTWLIFSDKKGFGEKIAEYLKSRNQKSLVVRGGKGFNKIADAVYEINPDNPADFLTLKDSVGEELKSLRGIIHLWNLDQPALDAKNWKAVPRTGLLSILYLVQAFGNLDSSYRLFIGTRNAVSIDEQETKVEAMQAAAWGLGRVIAAEQPDLSCTLLDLDETAQEADLTALNNEILADAVDREIAYRSNKRYVSRLAHYIPESPDSPDVKTKQSSLVPADPEKDAFFMDIPNPGLLENLVVQGFAPTPPGPGEIQVRAKATGVNFRDVMKTMGIYPDLPGAPIKLGDETSGTVVAVGPGVDEYNPGDEVITLGEYSMASVVTVKADLAVRKPAKLTAEEAATIPVVFLTAYYALNRLGRIARGEKILIHAAAGGVGIAAIQIARQAGAEIFATASESKQEYVRSLGVKHVYNSRDLKFYDQILKDTGGEGVDIVLNSLAGDFLTKSFALLKHGGRFLEIGKADIYNNNNLPMLSFRKNVSFHAIDLDLLFHTDPGYVGVMFREIIDFFESGDYSPLPVKSFPFSRIVDAFTFMSHAKHIGKLALSLSGDEIKMTPPRKTKIVVEFSADASYLITGGLGGLGLKMAEWMTESGARNIVLMGRRPPSADASESIMKLEAEGVKILTVSGDVSSEKDLKRIFGEIEKELPPLKGVFHAAGMLDDGTLSQIDAERFQKVLQPKIDGSWILHMLTRDMELDFFVLFSSVASLLGSPGQGNYASGNAFMDGLAHYRRFQGLPALSINWGPWKDAGMAANLNERRGTRGWPLVGMIDLDKGLELLGTLMGEDAPQVGVMPFDWSKFAEEFPSLASSPAVKEMIRRPAPSAGKGKSDEAKTGGEMLAEQIQKIKPEERQDAVLEYIKEQVAKVLGIQKNSLVDLQKGFFEMGMDSLMAVELRNRLQSKIEQKLPNTITFDYPNMEDMAAYIAEDVLDLDETPAEKASDAAATEKSPDVAAKTAASEPETAIEDSVATMSDEEAEAELLRELADLEQG